MNQKTASNMAEMHVTRYVPGPAEINPAQYLKRRSGREFVLGAAVPIVLLLAWQIAANINLIDDRSYPPPLQILKEGWELAVNGSLGANLWATLKRVLMGFATGATAGLALGFIMATSRNVRAAMEPTLSALYVVPKLAILPILLTMFGFGEMPKVMLVAITVFFFVWIDTMETVSAIPSGYRDAAKVFRCSGPQVFMHVLLPSVLPRLFVSLRIAMNVAVLVLIAAEFVISRDGLGYLIFNSRQLFINGWMFVGIVCVAAMGVILAAIVGRIGRFLTPWNRLDHNSQR